MKQPATTSTAAPLPDEQATRLLMQLLAIPGPSGGERKVVEFLRQQLGKAGVSSSELKTDDAQRRSALGGAEVQLRLPLTAGSRATD